MYLYCNDTCNLRMRHCVYLNEMSWQSAFLSYIMQRMRLRTFISLAPNQTVCTLNSYKIYWYYNNAASHTDVKTLVFLTVCKSPTALFALSHECTVSWSTWWRQLFGVNIRSSTVFFSFINQVLYFWTWTKMLNNQWHGCSLLVWTRCSIVLFP